MKSVLAVGLEHIIAKTARHYRMFADLTKSDVIIYSRDISNLSQYFANKYSLKWEKVPQSSYNDLKLFHHLLHEFSPRHIELYHASESILAHIGYIMIAKLHHIPLVVYCRGGELAHWNKHPVRKKISILLGLKMASLVIYKEFFMMHTLNKLKIHSDKCYFLHNSVPINDLEPEEAIKRKGVIFLNSFKSLRHPEIAVEVCIRLANKFPQTLFTIAGDYYFKNGHSCRQDLEEAIVSSALANRIKLLGWIKEPETMYEKHSIFLLPAERVFLNYSLLEAMERALAPVVSKVEGADKIIDHAKNGLIVDLNSDAFTDAVEYLLSNQDIIQSMSKAAREKVKKFFDLKTNLQKLIDLYNNKLWQ